MNNLLERFKERPLWQKILIVLVALWLVGAVLTLLESPESKARREAAARSADSLAAANAEQAKKNVGVTRANFEKIVVDKTTKEEVIALLGTGFEVLSSNDIGKGLVETVIWRRGGSDTSITIQFLRGKVSYPPSQVNVQ